MGLSTFFNGRICWAFNWYFLPATYSRGLRYRRRYSIRWSCCVPGITPRCWARSNPLARSRLCWEAYFSRRGEGSSALPVLLFLPGCFPACLGWRCLVWVKPWWSGWSRWWWMRSLTRSSTFPWIRFYRRRCRLTCRGACFPPAILFHRQCSRLPPCWLATSAIECSSRRWAQEAVSQACSAGW